MSDIGFLIITRPMFVADLTTYVQWKQSQGFTVYVVTAEEIEEQFTGAELRFKLRNCIRHYHNTLDVQYALLIGDSVDLPVPTNGEPLPPATLSEPWNLPAGYYQLDGVFNGEPATAIQFTTLFYADLSDTVHFNEWKYLGNYAIAVGVMPVRTTQELTNILNKTIQSKIENQLSLVYSDDYYDAGLAAKIFQQIKLLGGAGLTLSQEVFGQANNELEIYAALCNRPGVIHVNGHGLMTPDNPNRTPGFRVGNVWISCADGSRCQHLNRLYVINACWACAYQYGECIDEAWLKSEHGPVTMISKAPLTFPLPPEGGLSSSEQGFWQDLLAGKPLGKAFYDHCHGAYADPLNLFGDPSLIIFQSSDQIKPKLKIPLLYLLSMVWLLALGILLLTPAGIFCIKCNVSIEAPGYIGDPVVTLLGIGAIIMGLRGLISRSKRWKE